jgi:hypothetical protein
MHVPIRRFLTPLLRPNYNITIEQHIYLNRLPSDEQLIGIPDALVVASDDNDENVAVAVAPSVTVQALEGELPLPEIVYERYLEIHDATHHSEVITVIEVLSPTNKTTRNRSKYEQKRLEILGSLTNLVEIDLIRAGKPFPMKISNQKSSDYRVVISRSEDRPKADIYLFGVRDKIPDFPIPLRAGKTEPILPLNKILHDLYDLGSYDLSINYSHPPKPALY